MLSTLAGWSKVKTFLCIVASPVYQSQLILVMARQKQTARKNVGIKSPKVLLAKSVRKQPNPTRLSAKKKPSKTAATAGPQPQKRKHRRRPGALALK